MKKDLELILTNQIKMEVEALRNMFKMKLLPILYPIQPLVLNNNQDSGSSLSISVAYKKGKQ
jgi:hypothetical protein